MKTLPTSHPLVKSVLRQFSVVVRDSDARIIAELVTATLPLNRDQDLGPSQAANTDLGPVINVGIGNPAGLVGSVHGEPWQATAKLAAAGHPAMELGEDQNIAHDAAPLPPCPYKNIQDVYGMLVAEQNLKANLASALEHSRVAGLRQQETIRDLQKTAMRLEESCKQLEVVLDERTTKMANANRALHAAGMEKDEMAVYVKREKANTENMIKSIRMVLDGKLHA